MKSMHIKAPILQKLSEKRFSFSVKQINQTNITRNKLKNNVHILYCNFRTSFFNSLKHFSNGSAIYYEIEDLDLYFDDKGGVSYCLVSYKVGVRVQLGAVAIANVFRYISLIISV